MIHYSVLIVEDHPLFSKGLAMLIESQHGYKVIGEVRSVFEAMNIFREKNPTLVIVDLNLGDHDGLELIKGLCAWNPNAVILVLSMHDERYYAERALRAGARGYLMKEAGSDKVIEAIKTVMSGEIYLSKTERTRLSEYIPGNGMEIRSDKDWYACISKLTDRQLQIFSLIGKGFGTVEIAAKLSLSTKTVDTHKENIKIKLHCNTTQELRQLAVEWSSQ